VVMAPLIIILFFPVVVFANSRSRLWFSAILVVHLVFILVPLVVIASVFIVVPLGLLGAWWSSSAFAAKPSQPMPRSRKVRSDIDACRFYSSFHPSRLMSVS
jgi:hypothetical protein